MVEVMTRKSVNVVAAVVVVVSKLAKGVCGIERRRVLVVSILCARQVAQSKCWFVLFEKERSETMSMRSTIQNMEQQ